MCRVIGFSVLLLAAGWLASAPAGAQPTPVEEKKKSPAGTELFRALLDRKGCDIKPILAKDIPKNTRYDDVILISLGQRNQWTGAGTFIDDYFYAQRVLDGGGAVLLATDTNRQFQLGSQVGNSRFRIDFAGISVVCNDVSACYRLKQGDPPVDGPALTDCPFVVPSPVPNNEDEREPIWRIFRGPDGPLNRVVTNKPSYLTATLFDRNLTLRPIAVFPKNSKTAGGFQLPNNALFAVACDLPPARFNLPESQFVAMADHSLFINQSLIAPGTDNLDMTYELIDYLRGPTKRKRCIFIEDGRVVEQFDELRQAYAQQQAKKKDTPPIPGIDLRSPKLQAFLVELGNTLFDRAQTNDVLNYAVLGSPSAEGQRTRRLRDIALFFLVLGSIWAAWFLLRKVWGSRKPTDTPAAPQVAGAPVGPPGVFERRQKELLRRNNVYEPVRDLVREFFATVGIHGEQGPKVPRVAISDVVRKPDSLREAIRDLWRLAFGPPQVLSVGRWRELEPYFERVRKAHADGKWQFEAGATGKVA